MPTMRKMMRFSSAFSLNAPWNWVAIRLQKPRFHGLSAEGSALGVALGRGSEVHASEPGAAGAGDLGGVVGVE
jgi:hypothetical protein